MKKPTSNLSIVASVVLTAPWLWFVFGAVTWQSWWIGLWGIAVTWLPAVCLICLRKPVLAAKDEVGNRSLSKCFLLSHLSWVAGLTTIIIIQTPSRVASENSPVSSQFVSSTRGEIPVSRFALSNIVPEKEQINLGFRLMPMIDPFLTNAQVREVAGDTFKLYDELESDPNFHELGSMLGAGYAEIGRRPFDCGHYFLYDPVTSELNKDQPKPAIVFLHGSGGNFKPYLWLWSKLAEREGIVIVAPTYGFGNWDREKGVEAVRDALADAMSKSNIASDRVYLAGLSNGGLGVCRVAEQFPSKFRALVFLSPVMDRSTLDSPLFIRNWQSRPMLFITGESDRRIPLDYVSHCANWLEENHVKVNYHPIPDEDHFLFFSQPELVLGIISKWLREND